MTTRATGQMTRRRLLGRGALGLSALAASSALPGGLAWAGGKPSKQQLAAGKARRPPATPVKDVLSAEAQELGDLLVHKARHALAQAAANPKESFHPRSLQAASARVLQRASPKRRERAHDRATKLLSAPPAARAEQFGAYANASIAAAKVTPAPDVQLTKLVRKLRDRHAGKKADPQPKPAPSYRRIEFQLNGVDCIDATHGEWESDELLLGGHLVEPGGNIVSIKQWKVSDDFDDGETRQYDYTFCKNLGPTENALTDYFREAGYCPHGGPDDLHRGRTLASSKLDGPWPGTWTLVMMAGEQDSGGFGDLLRDAYKAMRSEIDDALEAAGVALGTAAGSLIPIPGIGSLIGAAVGYALSKLVELFVQLFDNPDDFVGARTWNVSLHDAHRSTIEALADAPLSAPKGVWASPMRTMTMRGDGSHYELRLHWRAFA